MTATAPVQSNALGLATELRQQTRVVHDQAETSPFIAQLGAGLLPLSAYTAMAAQNYAIYTALEQLGESWRDDPVAGPFVFDELLRVPSLERDLAYLLGPEWSVRAAALVEPATRRYVLHLHEVCSDWSAGWVAHHYVRYLGDLSGGQIIRRGLEQVYGEAGRLGTSFYVFNGIDKVKPFRDQYRRLLDHAPIGPLEQQRVVGEAIGAFELNRLVFVDLAATNPPLEGGEAVSTASPI
jgi:heme oxygenase